MQFANWDPVSTKVLREKQCVKYLTGTSVSEPREEKWTCKIISCSLTMLKWNKGHWGLMSG